MVLSLHHLLFGGQVYHSLLLLDLFELSFQCMELPPPLVVASTAASYCLYFGLFSLPLSPPLHFAHCSTQLSGSSLLSIFPGPCDSHLNFMLCTLLCWALFPEVCTVYGALLTILPSHGTLSLDSPGCILSLTISP